MLLDLQSLMLSDIDLPAIMALSIPLLALGIPIIALLIKHQQTMAQIIHGNNPDLLSEVSRLRNRVEQLAYRVNQQELMLGGATQNPVQPYTQAPPPAGFDVRERLGS